MQREAFTFWGALPPDPLTSGKGLCRWKRLDPGEVTAPRSPSFPNVCNFLPKPPGYLDKSLAITASFPQ